VDAVRARLEADLYAFTALIFDHLGLPRPTPVQRDILAFMQDPTHKRKIIQAFRGVGKSWLCSVYVLWLLYRDPHLKILVVSASKERSDAFSIFCHRLLNEIEFLKHLRPDPTRGDRASMVSFDVRPAGAAHAPSVKSVGIGGQVTGSRADIIVVDDAEVANNSESALQREKLFNRLNELGGAVLTPKDDSAIIYLGTPQVEDTIYTRLRRAGYVTRIWPAEIPEHIDRYEGCLGPVVTEMIEAGAPTGTPTDPDRFNRFELDERRTLEYGRAGYARQFLLDTTLTDEDRHPLKLRDLIIFDTDAKVAPDRLVWGSAPTQEIAALPQVGLPGDRWYRPAYVAEQFTPYAQSIMYVDPSGRGRDETAYAVVKELHGLLYLRRWSGVSGDGASEATMAKLAAIAKDERVQKIYVESNFGDGMWAQLFRPVLRRIYVATAEELEEARKAGRHFDIEGAGCAVEDDHVTGQKEARAIDSLEPVISGHRLVVDRKVVDEDTRDKRESGDHEAALKSGFFQLTRITRERGCLKFDDRIDALAGAVKKFAGHMALDIEGAEQSEKDARLDVELEKIREHWLGPGNGRSDEWGGRDIVH